MQRCCFLIVHLSLVMSGFKTKDSFFYPESRFDLTREKPMCSRRESLQAYRCQLYAGSSAHCVLESHLVPRVNVMRRQQMPGQAFKRMVLLRFY